jgi:cytochrome b561
MATAKSYSKTQIILHWLIVMMVVFQYVAHDSIQNLWFERLRGTIPNEPTPDIHVAMGIAIFILAVWRVWLLIRNGAPELPANEPRWAQILAKSVHGLLYLALFALPISGSFAWFFGIEQAMLVHGLIKNLLILLIGLHVAGALYQHYILRSNVLMRMLGRA